MEGEHYKIHEDIGALKSEVKNLGAQIVDMKDELQGLNESIVMVKNTLSLWRGKVTGISAVFGAAVSWVLSQISR